MLPNPLKPPSGLLDLVEGVADGEDDADGVGSLGLLSLLGTAIGWDGVWIVSGQFFEDRNQWIPL